MKRSKHRAAVNSLVTGNKNSYELLENRVLLAADFVSDVNLHPSQVTNTLTEFQYDPANTVKTIVAGDPNGNPPSNPNTIIDSNVGSSAFAGVVGLNISRM